MTIDKEQRIILYVTNLFFSMGFSDTVPVVFATGKYQQELGITITISPPYHNNTCTYVHIPKCDYLALHTILTYSNLYPNYLGLQLQGRTGTPDCREGVNLVDLVITCLNK
jgi:hypothetical protein